MSLTRIPPDSRPGQDAGGGGGPSEPFDPLRAEGLAPDRNWREWMMVAAGLTSLLAIAALIVSMVTLAEGPSPSATTVVRAAAASPSASTSAPTLAQAKGIAYEKFQPVDPTLPAVPAGAVKKFTVSVIQHVVQVSPDLAPVQAWTYTVNGVAYRGTAASPPMVVNQGDRVQITFVNGTGKSSGVDMAHSIDIHAAQIAPNLNYVDVAPGQKKVISFTAGYAGVFMYHCATQPVLMHTGSGMTGMLVVKPRDLPPAAKEIWLVQNEFYIGKPGGLADEAKMEAETPDVVGFNGYANQYKFAPIDVPVGKDIRLYVLNAGPSKWSAFHVIGGLFSTTRVEGVTGHGAQTVSLAPSQGAILDLTLRQRGNYTFVTHNFGDMVKGAAGILHTSGAPAPTGVPAPPTGGSTRPVLPSTSTSASTSAPSAAGLPAGTVASDLGDMWIHSSLTSARAGVVRFEVKNVGQMDHWWAIMRLPVKMSGGELDASATLAKTAQLAPGASQTLAVKLSPGRYELVCLMPGHYNAGQHEDFTVTG